MSSNKAIGSFVVYVLIYQIVVSLVIGVLIGYTARRALHLAETHKWMDRENFLSFSIAQTVSNLKCNVGRLD